MGYFIASVFTALVLSGCTTAKITKAPNLPAGESYEPAYIWNFGIASVGFYDTDYAVMQRLIGKDFDIQITGVKLSPYGELTAVPAGQYTATFAHMETKACPEVIARDLVLVATVVFMNHVGSGGCKEVREICTLPLTVLDDHLYHPFADNKCGRNWCWIEDWGSATENGAPKFSSWGGHERYDYMPTRAPVVAGEKPPRNCP